MKLLRQTDFAKIKTHGTRVNRSLLVVLLACGLVEFGHSPFSSGRSAEIVRKPAGDTYVEITAELNSTWISGALTNQHQKKATCIVGRNTWFISGDFLENAREDYWRMGQKVIEERTITSSMYVKQAKEFVAEKVLGEKRQMAVIGKYPHAGEKFTRTHDEPAGEGMAKVIWLAFCSGNFLNQRDRAIPLPIGPSHADSVFSDKTERFEDDQGLPKRVELYLKDQLACEYQVLESTNFIGRSFPVKFRIFQKGVQYGHILPSKTELIGKLVSIRVAEEPKVPKEVLERLNLQTPSDITNTLRF